MGIGDLVCWKNITNTAPFKDVGIILSVEASDSPYALFKVMVEVYFMRIGHLWCAPHYLQVLSPYQP